MRLREITYISLCAIILAICSWVTIPSVVPFTLGTFGVYLVTLLLGGKRGTIAVAIHILLGLIGVPVFSGFRGGATVLLGATGGYIVMLYLWNAMVCDSLCKEYGKLRNYGDFGMVCVPICDSGHYKNRYGICCR